MNDLLPCPFCGNEARMVQLAELPEDDPNWNGWFVECSNANCAATTNIHFGEADQALRQKWNRRTLPKKENGPFDCETCRDTGEIEVACPDCGFPKDRGYGAPSA